ncbi:MULTISPECIES: hypothetical protein [Amycolatopsis]|uniref:hypothetical protein n=1 Tax=Amycolatopsis TaxID=1813 RepID=UPI0007E09FF9|nr:MULTISPECIES: hypothetical protein [Amycolatopsis]OAP23872.1 hypothetical protein A4R44_05379 [Amycolatopsis sp. M39]
MTNSPGAPGPGDDTPTPSRGFASPDPDASAATPPETGETDTSSGASAGTSSPVGENAASTGANPPAGTNQTGADPSAASESPAGATPRTGGESPAGATPRTGGENPAGATPRTGGESPAGATPRTGGETSAGASSSTGTTPSQPSAFPPPGATPPPPAGGGQWQSPGQQPLPQYPGAAHGRPGAGWNPNGLGKPGVIALRPLNVGDILDGAITAIRRYPLLILGVAAVVAVISAGLNLVASLWLVPDFNRVAQLGPAATQQQQLDAAYSVLGSTLSALLPVLVISMLTQTFLTGFLTVVMGKAVLGRPVDFGSAMREAAPRLLPLLAVTILYTLATIVAAAFCLLPAVLPYVFWSLAGPALVLERGTIGQAFTRSRQLVSGMFWRVFGVLLLAGVISWLISAIISVPFSLGSGAFSGIFDPQATLPKVTTGGLVLQSVGKVIAETIVMPFTALVTVTLYIDQRMRREGMDIELARAAGIQPPQPPQQAW